MSLVHAGTPQAKGFHIITHSCYGKDDFLVLFYSYLNLSQDSTVLNVGLRPHLTRWQAEFRRWYERAKTNPANAARSPQAIQRDFGQYAELTEDLQRILSAMVKYTDILSDLAEGAERGAKTVRV
jgi:hypothetical protein